MLIRRKLSIKTFKVEVYKNGNGNGDSYLFRKTGYGKN